MRVRLLEPVYFVCGEFGSESEKRPRKEARQETMIAANSKGLLAHSLICVGQKV
jgi:hypothetical protein